MKNPSFLHYWEKYKVKQREVELEEEKKRWTEQSISVSWQHFPTSVLMAD